MFTMPARRVEPRARPRGRLLSPSRLRRQRQQRCRCLSCPGTNGRVGFNGQSPRIAWRSVVTDAAGLGLHQNLAGLRSGDLGTLEAPTGFRKFSTTAARILLGTGDWVLSTHRAASKGQAKDAGNADDAGSQAVHGLRGVTQSVQHGRVFGSRAARSQRRLLAAARSTARPRLASIVHEFGVCSSNSASR